MAFEEKLLKIIKILIVPVILLAAAIGWGAQQYIYRQIPQPIAFSHQIHAGTRQISCTFCHTGVKHGTNAGVPSVQDCMQCHQVVATDKPEIKKLTEEYWQKGRPIEWFKVYNMPEHVRFSHKAHINAEGLVDPGRVEDPRQGAGRAGVACAVCHGDVAKMSTVAQARNFVMGTCVSCHRQNKASTDCTICHK